jgi:hypothetical protein
MVSFTVSEEKEKINCCKTIHHFQPSLSACLVSKKNQIYRISLATLITAKYSFFVNPDPVPGQKRYFIINGNVLMLQHYFRAGIFATNPMQLAFALSLTLALSLSLFFSFSLSFSLSLTLALFLYFFFFFSFSRSFSLSLLIDI